MYNSLLALCFTLYIMAAISRRANSNSGGDESLLAAVVYIYKVLVKIAWHL